MFENYHLYECVTFTEFGLNFSLDLESQSMSPCLDIHVTVHTAVIHSATAIGKLMQYCTLHFCTALLFFTNTTLLLNPGSDVSPGGVCAT